jgi:Tol biopolymer transport system component
VRTPDGKNIVFQSTNPAAPGLYWVRSDGSDEAQRLTDGKLDQRPSSFSPDGKRPALQQTGNKGSPDILTAPVESDPASGALGIPEAVHMVLRCSHRPLAPLRARALETPS